VTTGCGEVQVRFTLTIAVSRAKQIRETLGAGYSSRAESTMSPVGGSYRKPMYPVAMVNPVPNKTVREFIVYVLGTGGETTPFLADCFRLTEWWATSPKEPWLPSENHFGLFVSELTGLVANA